MKFLNISVVMLLCLMSLIGCEKSEKLTPQEEIIGTWKLSEIYIDIGDGSGEFNKVENGYEYKFNTDNTFTSTRFADCQKGNYALNIDELTLDFDCESIKIGNRILEGSLIEKIDFDSDALILTPTYIICIEGCGWKFEKIK